jgi:hypothetical protein
VFKSTDAGISWHAANIGLNGEGVSVLAIDPVTPTTLYAGISNFIVGVFKSTDGGISWSGLENFMFGHVDTLAIDPQRRPHGAEQVAATGEYSRG